MRTGVADAIGDGADLLATVEHRPRSGDPAPSPADRPVEAASGDERPSPCPR
jgi:hypothetical protein